MPEIYVNDIREFLGLEHSTASFSIECVDALRVGEKVYSSLMFINKPDIDLKILDSLSEHCVYIVDISYGESYTTESNDFICINNPKYKFCRVVKNFKLDSRLQLGFNHDQSSLLVDPNIYCHETLIGRDFHIDSGTIIGGTDFSPVFGDDGELSQFPQLGGVKLGDNVVVKYNTMIGKGTFGYTEIGDNTMIDFGCQIGHNCIIGKSCIIAAGTIIGGSTILGDNCVVGMGATIRNGIVIGDNVSIGMGSVVIHDVPKGCTVVGNPARIIEHEHIFTERGLI